QYTAGRYAADRRRGADRAVPGAATTTSWCPSVPPTATTRRSPPRLRTLRRGRLHHRWPADNSRLPGLRATGGRGAGQHRDGPAEPQHGTTDPPQNDRDTSRSVARAATQRTGSGCVPTGREGRWSGPLGADLA